MNGKHFFQKVFSYLLYDNAGESSRSISTCGVLEQDDLLAVTEESLDQYGYQKKPLFYYAYSLGGSI